jgi:hypothetical protein
VAGEQASAVSPAVMAAGVELPRNRELYQTCAWRIPKTTCSVGF